MGSCYVFLGQLPKALAEYLKATVIEQTEGAYWRGAGLASYHMDKLIAAEEYLQRAVGCGYEIARADYEEVAGALASRQADLEVSHG